MKKISIKTSGHLASSSNLIAEMPPAAYPGDGVCPTVSQFYTAHETSHRAWKQLASDLACPHVLDKFHVAERLVGLLRQIPPFGSRNSVPFFVIDEPYHQIKLILEWETTTELTCRRRVKQLHYFQTVGLLETTKYQFSDNTVFSLLDGRGIQTDYISYFVLAWTYVLSCRWLEILQFAGENVTLYQEQEITPQCFWEVISVHRWKAVVTRGAKSFCAPWSLEDQNSKD